MVFDSIFTDSNFYLMDENITHNIDINIADLGTQETEQEVLDGVLKSAATYIKETEIKEAIKQIEQDFIAAQDTVPAEGGVTGISTISVSNTTPSVSAGSASLPVAKKTTTATPISGGSMPSGGNQSSNSNGVSAGSGMSTGVSSTMTTSGAGNQVLPPAVATTSQIYAGSQAQQIIVPQNLQGNTDAKPTLEEVKEYVATQLEAAEEGSETKQYWQKVSDALQTVTSDEAVEAILGKDKKEEYGVGFNLLSDWYKTKTDKKAAKKENNYDWGVLREELISKINQNIIKDGSEETKSYWGTIVEKLKDESVNIENLFEQYDELFLLLKEIKGELPDSICIYQGTKVYPNLTADKMYADIGVGTIYDFLKKQLGTHVVGKGVKKGGVIIEGTTEKTHLHGSSLTFVANDFYKSSKLEENINWIVYKTKKDFEIFENEGAAFTYNFENEGTYVVEAFGSAHSYKGKSSAYVEVTIKQPEIGKLTCDESLEKRIKPSLDTLYRCSIASDMEGIDFMPAYLTSITWELKRGGNIVDQKVGASEVYFTFEKGGNYTVCVYSTFNAKKVITKTVKVGNYVRKITPSVPKKAYFRRDYDQCVTFKATKFGMSPVTDEEKLAVKWLVYRNGKEYLPEGYTRTLEEGDVKKPYIGMGESFDFPIPKKDGLYFIEAYSNSVDGLRSTSSFALEVYTPQVLTASWATSNGGKKYTAGLGGEEVYVKAQIAQYKSQKVAIHFVVNDKKIKQKPIVVTTDADGNINYKIPLTNALKSRLQLSNTNSSKVRFMLEGVVDGKPYAFKKPLYKPEDATLLIKTEQEIIDAYFMYDNKRVKSTDKVAYGSKVKAVVETNNMIGKTVSVNVYRNTLGPDTIIDGDVTTVNKEGIASREFILKIDWYEMDPFGKDTFYVGSEEVNGINWIVSDKKFVNSGLKAVEAGKVVKKADDKYGIDVDYFLKNYDANEGLKELLNNMNVYYTSKKENPRKEHIAYMLATVKLETAGTFKPIAERGSASYIQGMYDPVLGKNEERKSMALAHGNTAKGDGEKYKGRGYVQLTWKNNYIKVKKEFNVDVVSDPKKIMEPVLATKVMIWGMKNGIFTGVGLNKYINDSKTDYVNARRIINGTDKADKIAGYAKEFEQKIKVSKVKELESSVPKSIDVAVTEMKKIADQHVTYSQESNSGKSKGLRTDINDRGLAKMDCSEFVCRYLHKLGITNNVKVAVTSNMTSESSFQKKIGSKRIKLVGTSKSFKPRKGDIFVWRTSSGGHTGIVYSYNSSKDLVTVLEALGGSGSADETTNKENGGHTGKGVTRTSIYKRTGKALFGHKGFIGYFRPVNE